MILPMLIGLGPVFQQMTVLIDIVDKCLSVLVFDGAFNIHLDLLIHFPIEAGLPVLLGCRRWDGMNLPKNSPGFQAVSVLGFVGIIQDHLFSILPFNPALEEKDTLFAKAQSNGLAHGDPQGCNLLHHGKFGLLFLVLGGIGNP